jgi:predicted ABC-type ATPase
MSGPPIFHLLAGPNGAGKSTLFKALVAHNVLSKNLPFINADVYERNNLGDISDLDARSEAARAWADSERSRLLASRVSFVSETVFSHPSKLTLISQALTNGFLVVLYIVAVDNPELLLKRVEQRVKEGGHAVSADRILSRYPRTLKNLHSAIRMASVSYIYDSSADNVDVEATLNLVAIYQPSKGGESVRLFSDTIPRWAHEMISMSNPSDENY